MSHRSLAITHASPLLSVRELTVGFDTMEGQVTAVDRLSFGVNQGETLGLVGESGCGKSVTALSILRLLASPPAWQTGRIEFEGRELLALDPEEMRRIRGREISMIFQEPMTSLNPVMTIGSQITEAVMAHKGVPRDQAWKQAVEMLERVQIPSPGQRAREYPHRMSGGMRQRAMIAMALSCQPKLLLADEPTTALDVTIQAQIMELMQGLRDEFQTSMVLITHDMGLIAEMARRVVVMYAGQLVEQARVKDLFKGPLHPYTRGLLGSIPVPGRKFKKGRSSLTEIKGAVPPLRDMPIGCRFRPRCNEATGQCRQDPPLLGKGKGRKVRCWLWA